MPQQDRALTVVSAKQTCLACPTLWHVRTINGTELYLRFRHGRGSVHLADNYDVVLATFAYGDPLLGYIEFSKFAELAGLVVADDADISSIEHQDW